MSEKRILAVFVPESWINDSAVEIDGRVEFDVTAAVLAMSPEDRRNLRDDSYESDDLVPDEIRDRHDGPFRVEIQAAIEAYFSDDHGVPAKGA